MIINNINKTKIIAGPMPLHPHPLFINFPPFISLIIYYGKEIFLCMIFYLVASINVILAYPLPFLAQFSVGVSSLHVVDMVLVSVSLDFVQL